MFFRSSSEESERLVGKKHTPKEEVPVSLDGVEVHNVTTRAVFLPFSVDKDLYEKKVFPLVVRGS